MANKKVRKCKRCNQEHVQPWDEKCTVQLGSTGNSTDGMDGYHASQGPVSNPGQNDNSDRTSQIDNSNLEVVLQTMFGKLEDKFNKKLGEMSQDIARLSGQSVDQTTLTTSPGLQESMTLPSADPSSARGGARPKDNSTARPHASTVTSVSQPAITNTPLASHSGRQTATQMATSIGTIGNLTTTVPGNLQRDPVQQSVQGAGGTEWYIQNAWPVNEVNVVQGNPVNSQVTQPVTQATQQAPHVQQATSWSHHNTPVASALDSQQPVVVHPTQTMHELRTNRMLQSEAEGRMSNMESHMGNELGGKRTKSGRRNTQEAAAVDPLVRWPNEAFPLGTADRGRPAYDDLTLTQFVIGMNRNLLDIDDHNIRSIIMGEMNLVLETSETVGWPIARDSFAQIMHKIEERALVWTDSMGLLQARVQASQRAWMQAAKGSNQQGHIKRHKPHKQYPCWHHNHAYCDRGGRHWDKHRTVEFLHICELCDSRGITEWGPDFRFHFSQCQGRPHSESRPDGPGQWWVRGHAPHKQKRTVGAALSGGA